MDNDNDIIKFLLDWAENYFRSKDAFHKKIISINHGINRLSIEFKDKKEIVIALPDLNSFVDMGCKDNISIITINNRKNVESLYTNWDKFIDLHTLKVYFINPLSTTENKWVINPYTHSKICDMDALKVGLMTMFESVEPLTREILQARL